VLQEPITDLGAWPGVTASTPLANDYAEKLRSMSSAMPQNYRHALLEYGYHLEPAAVMLLPGGSPELVRLAFQVSGMTGSSALA
jgi:hypothetical protein